MNLVEIYLKELHSIEKYDEEWTKKFSDREFVKVDATWDCYGTVYRVEEIFSTKQWEEIKTKGYYLV